MNTIQELAEQSTHEKRMRDDLEYAIEFRKQEIYEDLVNFQQFMEDHQMYNQIGRELLRALCNVEHANKGTGKSSYAVLDAIDNIKKEIDAKIEYIERNK